MNHPDDILNPDDFVIVPHVAVLDEFQLTNDAGTFVADITPAFLDELVKHMTERERLTGDLSPLVIGHTKSGEREIDGPLVVGFAKNWHRGELGETGRQCAFIDAWIRKEYVELVRNYPRRSSEVWVSRHEIDPISLLGATTPSRDLGLLKLSREGSFSYDSPGVMTMPEPKTDPKTDPKPAADPKNTGESKGLEGKIDQLLQMFQQLLASGGGGACAPGAGAGAAASPSAGAGAGAGDQMSDEEFEKLMSELGGGAGEGAEAHEPSRKEEKPVQNSAYGADPDARLARLEAELSDARVRLARGEVVSALTKIKESGRDVNPEDEAHVSDLIAMEPGMRARELDRLAKLSRPLPGRQLPGLNAAVDAAVTGGGKRVTRDDVVRLQRAASEKKISFEEAARAEGFTL